LRGEREPGDEEIKENLLVRKRGHRKDKRKRKLVQDEVPGQAVKAKSMGSGHEEMARERTRSPLDGSGGT